MYVVMDLPTLLNILFILDDDCATTETQCRSDISDTGSKQKCVVLETVSHAHAEEGG